MNKITIKENFIKEKNTVKANKNIMMSFMKEILKIINELVEN
jgi:hypothetical protein